MSLMTLLSVAIALAFAYFLLSSVASAINEAIGAALKRRSNGLEQAILALVGGPLPHKPILARVAEFIRTSVGRKEAGENSAGTSVGGEDKPGENPALIAQQVYRHGLVSGLSSIVRPSYVPSRNFTHALIDVLAKDGGYSLMKSLQNKINNLPPDHPLTQALRSAATEAQGDIEAFKASVDKWFDDAMDRLSGAYKRWTQAILFGVGLCLAFAFNVDTVHMVSALMADRPALAKVVEAANRATETMAEVRPGPDKAIPPGGSPAPVAGTAQGAAASQGTATPSRGETAQPAGTAEGTDARTLEQDIVDSQRNILDAMDKLLAANLPIGWQACPAKPDGPGVTCWKAGDWFPTIYGLGGAIVGWLLTAIAISFGAPFWFDLLNTFVNIRATGPKPKATNKDDASATS